MNLQEREVVHDPCHHCCPDYTTSTNATQGQGLQIMNNLHIYVLDRGFVLLGRAREHERGDDFSTYILDNCAVIRVWGTTEGLGQIAKDGPTKDTKLDREGDGIELNKKFIMRRIPCTGEWSKKWK